MAAKKLEAKILLLDFDLPGDAGGELIDRMRTISNVHMTMVTARSDEATAIARLAAGADDIMAKPFTRREVVARMQAILRRACPGPQCCTDRLHVHDMQGRRVFGALSVDLLRRAVAVLPRLSMDR